jgi:hypothetical protein
MVRFDSGSGEIAEQANNDASTQMEPNADAKDNTANASAMVATEGATQTSEPTKVVPEAVPEGPTTASMPDSVENESTVVIVDETVP